MAAECKLMKNTLILGVSSVVSKAVAFLLMPLYTACLSPAEFGVADILISTAVFLLPLVSLNAPEAIFRFVAGGEKSRGAVSAGVCSALGGLFLFSLCLPLFGKSSLFAPYLWLFFCYVLFAVIHSFAAYLVRAGGDYTLFALQQLFCALLTVLFELIFLPILSLGVGGYLGAVFLSDGLVAVWLLIVLSKKGRLKLERFSKDTLFSMWRYALPLIPAAALWWVISLSDRYVLLRYHGQAVTGIYAAAGKIPALLTFAAGIFLEVWRYASVRATDDRRGYFGRIYGMFLPTVIGMAGGLSVCGGALASFLFSASYKSAAGVVPILTVASLFSVLASFLGSVYALQKTSFRSLLTALAGASVNLFFNFLLIPRFAATGAAIATLLAWCTVWLLRAWDCGKAFPFAQRLGKTLLSTLLCTAAAFSVMAGKIGAGVYFAAAALTVFYRELWEMFRLFWGILRELLLKIEKRGKPPKNI